MKWFPGCLAATVAAGFSLPGRNAADRWRSKEPRLPSHGAPRLRNPPSRACLARTLAANPDTPRSIRFGTSLAARRQMRNVDLPESRLRMPVRPFVPSPNSYAGHPPEISASALLPLGFLSVLPSDVVSGPAISRPSSSTVIRRAAAPEIRGASQPSFASAGSPRSRQTVPSPALRLPRAARDAFTAVGSGRRERRQVQVLIPPAFRRNRSNTTHAGFRENAAGNPPRPRRTEAVEDRRSALQFEAARCFPDCSLDHDRQAGHAAVRVAQRPTRGVYEIEVLAAVAAAHAQDVVPSRASHVLTRLTSRERISTGHYAENLIDGPCATSTSSASDCRRSARISRALHPPSPIDERHRIVASSPTVH